MYKLIRSVIVEKDLMVKVTIQQYQDDLPVPINAKEEFFDAKEDGSPCGETIVHPPLIRV